MKSRQASSHESADLSQLALWMAGNLAGLVTAVMLARGPFFKTMSKRVGRGKFEAKPPSSAQSLALLANTILGSGKEMIESVFGPPRGIAIEELGVLVHPQHLVGHSDTWYYPLPRNGKLALGITFHDQIATRVEFFTTPSHT